MALIIGKGDSHKKTYCKLFVGTLIILINLDKGNVYILIYPSIDAEAHKFKTLLQKRRK